MNRAQVETLTRQWLGFNASLSQAIIFAHFDSVQAELEYEDLTLPRPWFLFDPDADRVTVAQQRHVEPPTGFIDLDEEWSVKVEVNGLLKRVRRETEDQLQRTRYYQGNETDVLEGYPEFYAFDGNRFYFYPLPDAVYTVKIPCFQRSALLSVSATHDWFDHFPNFIAMKTASSIMRATRDETGFKFMGSKLDLYHPKYLATLEVKKHRQMDYYVGAQ